MEMMGGTVTRLYVQPDKTWAASLNLDPCKLVQVQIPDT